MKPIMIRKLDCGHWTMIMISDTEVEGVFITVELLHADDYGEVLALLNSRVLYKVVLNERYGKK